MIKEITKRLRAVESQFNDCQKDCEVLLDEYKFASVPNVDEVQKAYHLKVRNLYRLAKVKQHLEKVIKHLSKMEDIQ